MNRQLLFALVCRGITIAAIALALAFGAVIGSPTIWLNPAEGTQVVDP